MEHVNWRRFAPWGIPLAALPFSRPFNALSLGVLSVGALSLGMVGCDADVSTNPSSPGSVLSVYVKDAPGDVDSVWVQVNDIVLVGDGGETSLLDRPTHLLNLTLLQDSALALVERHVITPGSFTQVRFALGGAVLETSAHEVYALGGAEDPDGLPTTRNLQCPSCAESGIKVQLGREMVLSAGDTTALVLDFDVARSFGHPAGSSAGWVMHPVIQGRVGLPGRRQD